MLKFLSLTTNVRSELSSRECYICLHTFGKWALFNIMRHSPSKQTGQVARFWLDRRMVLSDFGNLLGADCVAATTLTFGWQQSRTV